MTYDLGLFTFLLILLFFATPALAQLDFEQDVVTFPGTHEADRYRWDADRNPSDVAFTLEQLRDGSRFRLSFRKGPDGTIDELHVLVTDRKLRDFEYIHPEKNDAGGYEFDVHPRRSGRHRIEIVLRSGTRWIDLRRDMDLAPRTDEPEAGADDALHVAVKPLQRFLYAGHVLTFMLDFRNGTRPVTDLEPIQGSDLQAATWNRSWFSSLEEFVYARAFQNTGGPEVPVSLVFPEPGTYVVFAGFRRGGRSDHVRFELDILREPSHDGQGGILDIQPADD